MINRRMLPLVVMLGWSVSSFAQSAQNPPLAGDRFQLACAPMRLAATPNQAVRVLGTYPDLTTVATSRTAKNLHGDAT